MAGFAAVIGVGTVCGMAGIPTLRAVLLFSSVFLIPGAGSAINDYSDADIDAINEPMRPIPSGRISRNAALRLSLMLFGLGIALAYTINNTCFAIALANSLMLIVYARNLKRTALAGNVSVGYLTDSTFLYEGALFGIPGSRPEVRTVCTCDACNDRMRDRKGHRRHRWRLRDGA